MKNFTSPKRLSLARVPTPIQPMSRLGKEYGIKGLYVKRDDLTGIGLSGNKVRKLEFLFAEALRKKATTVITCGGIQSNHARATTIAAVQLGLKPFLVLRGRKYEISEGNLFLDKLLGANILFITPEEYKNVNSIMQREAKKLQKKGEKVYIIPEGGSNELGLMGYVEAMREVKAQEKELKKTFDYLVTAVGSGGTLAGMALGKKIFGLRGEILGVNVCDDAAFFTKKVLDLVSKACKRFKISRMNITEEDFRILDGYVGPGYSIPTDENIELIKQAARSEGIVLDPVYTSKAFYGMLKEIEKGSLKKNANILFIHTGGIFGLLAQREHFDFL